MDNLVKYIEIYSMFSIHLIFKLTIRMAIFSGNFQKYSTQKARELGTDNIKQSIGNNDHRC